VRCVDIAKSPSSWNRNSTAASAKDWIVVLEKTLSLIATIVSGRRIGSSCSFVSSTAASRSTYRRIWQEKDIIGKHLLQQRVLSSCVAVGDGILRAEFPAHF